MKKQHTQRHPGTQLLAATLALLVSTTAFAAARDDLLAGYAAAAKSGPPALKRGHVQVELLKRGGSARRSWPAHGDTVSRTHGATAAVADMLTYLQ